MSLAKKILIVLFMAGAVSIIFLTWYTVQHSHQEVMPLPTTALQPLRRVLLASEEIDTKNLLMQEVIHRLEAEHVIIEVYHVSYLTDVSENEWSAIVVFRSVTPTEQDNNAFISRARTFDNTILVNSHEEDSYTIESIMTDPPLSVQSTAPAAQQIVQHVKMILNKKKIAS